MSDSDETGPGIAYTPDDRHRWSDRTFNDFKKTPPDIAPVCEVLLASVRGEGSIINRNALVIGHEPAFVGWLKGMGLAEEAIRKRDEVAERTVYLIPACYDPKELDEVIGDFFEEIFRQELQSWQPDEAYWPDTADFPNGSR